MPMSRAINHSGQGAGSGARRRNGEEGPRWSCTKLCTYTCDKCYKKIKNKKGSLRTYNELFEEGTMKQRLTGGVGLSK